MLIQIGRVDCRLWRLAHLTTVTMQIGGDGDTILPCNDFDIRLTETRAEVVHQGITAARRKAR